MQTELWEKHKDKWPPMQPEHGKDFILWMIEEVGEVISIIKKKSIHDIMGDPAVHSHFVEELSDVLMYLHGHSASLSDHLGRNLQSLSGKA